MRASTSNNIAAREGSGVRAGEVATTEDATIRDDSQALSNELKSEARRIGFDLVGIAPAVAPAGASHLQSWLESGFAGEMHYLERRRDAYSDPARVLDGVRSIVMLGLNYKTPDPPPLEPGDGRVARYAWAETDYHDILRHRLHQLADFLHAARPDCRTRGVVDTAPLLERDFARLAGLGWFGKNTMLINKRMGSWSFLAALLTDVDLTPDEPHATSHCGTCTRCLDACPTDAFPEPHVLDARKCISYLTIELRGQPIPDEFRPQMGDWAFGCDICQDVCPWNHKAPATNDPALQTSGDRHRIRLSELLPLSEDNFQIQYGDTPLARPGRDALVANACIAAGNTGDASLLHPLDAASRDSSPLVRDAADWARRRLAERGVVAIAPAVTTG
jgi:epoxyqueuosine reductase